MSEDDIARRVHAVLRHDDLRLSELTRIAGLHPAQHWRGANLRDVDFGEDDLRGFDFGQADLRGAKLSRVRNLLPEMFADALIDHRTELPADLRDALWPPRTALAQWREVVPGLPEAAWPDMVTIPEGSFLMGAPKNEEYSNENERPQRCVTIPRPFALGRTAVSFAMWDAAVAAGFMLPDGAARPDDETWGRDGRPVIHVNWYDARAYCAWLNERLGLRPWTYRLPSEAEWEYTCRAETVTPFSFGDTIAMDKANYNATSTYGRGLKGEYRARTEPVGTLPENPWGLREMHGNVWEWVEDAFGPYPDHATDSRPLVHVASDRRILRGGSWHNGPRNLRSANRFRGAPGNRIYEAGFRVARSLF